MVRHRFQIHSQFMSHGLECVTMIILEDVNGIFLHHHLHQIKIMLLDKESQIIFRKKFKYLIIFNIQIILIYVLMVVVHHTNNVDAIVNLLLLVSLVAAHLLIVLIMSLLNFRYSHIQIQHLYLKLALLPHIFNS